MTMAGDDRLPVTVLVPDTVAAPIEVYEQSAALRMAIVEPLRARGTRRTASTRRKLRGWKAASMTC
jgi:hypothetical protein